MALENVSSSTTVGEIDRAIKILNKVKSKATTAQEQELANKRINKFTYAKTKLLNVARSAVGKVNSENQKIALARLWQNKDTISLDEINKILESSNLAVANPEMLDNEPKDSLGMKILEGKTGVDYLTVVKTTLATSGVALLAKWGAFSAVKVGLGALFSFNPVIGVCAVVLGSATLIKYARQLFQPEINKIIARQRFKQNLEKTENEIPEQSIDMDKFAEEYANKQITEETIDKSETEEPKDTTADDKKSKKARKSSTVYREVEDKHNFAKEDSDEKTFADFKDKYKECIDNLSKGKQLKGKSQTEYFIEEAKKLLKNAPESKKSKYEELFGSMSKLLEQIETVISKTSEKGSKSDSNTIIIDKMNKAGFTNKEIEELTGLNIQEK